MCEPPALCADEFAGNLTAIELIPADQQKIFRWDTVILMVSVHQWRIALFMV